MAEKTERRRRRSSLRTTARRCHDYHVLDTWEAGVALLGTEVKSIREGRVNLRDSFARIDRGEVWLMNVHIGPYSHTDYVGTTNGGSASCCCTATRS